LKTLLSGLFIVLSVVGLSIFQNCGKAVHQDAAFLASKACQQEALPPYRPSLLTKTELKYVLSDLFPEQVTAQSNILKITSEIPDFSIDQIIDGSVYSENNSGVMPSELYLSKLLDVADVLFSQFKLSASYIKSCSGTDDVGCFQFLYQEVVEGLWRRPLLPTETKTFQDIFALQSSLNERANLLFITAMTSPQFYLKNYLPDKGQRDTLEYNGFSLASRLSFFLYNSVPDEELLKAAASGQLTTSRQLLPHIDRLLTNPKYLNRFIRHTLGEWIGLEKDLNSSVKMTNEAGVVLPISEMALAQYYRLYALVEENRPLSQFLNGNDVFMNKATAKYLGLNPAEYSDAFARVPASVEKNIYGSYFASPHFAKNTVNAANPLKTKVTARGFFMLKKFLCGNTPVNEVKPEDQNRVLGPNSGALPQVAVAAIRSRATSCRGCHQDVDRVGAGVEFVDAFGGVRMTYKDQTRININFRMTEKSARPIRNFPAFLEEISTDERVHSCFLKTLTNKVAKMHIQSAQPCVNQALYTGGPDQGVRDYLKGIVQSSFFTKASR
jgi:hypothetical protein